MQIGPPPQSNIDALNSATPNKYIDPPQSIAHSGLPYCYMHACMHAYTYIYAYMTLGAWNTATSKKYIGPPPSIEHRCLEYHYTNKYIGPSQSI